jgi:hypothetical protein
MFKTNRQQDEANEAAIADGERRYAASFEEADTAELNAELEDRDCSHEHTERLTGQATPGTFGRGRRPNSGVVDLCLECGARFEVR